MLFAANITFITNRRIVDSALNYILKKVTLSNNKAVKETYFNG